MQDTTFTFLVPDWQEIELELLTQCIAPNALGRGIVKITEIKSALKMARASAAMLALEQKYGHLEERVSDNAARSGKDVAKSIELDHASDFLH